MLQSKVRKQMFIALVVYTLFAFSMCATFYHAFLMKGQVIDVKDNSAYLCIGTRDGAKVGDIFKVYQYDLSSSGGEGATPSFDSKLIGEIKIAEIYSTHYAKANILSGKIRKGHVAELSK